MSMSRSTSPSDVGSSGGVGVDAALIQQLQGAASSSSGIGGNVKTKQPSFSGKKKDWPLFKMQMIVYLATLGPEGVLAEAFDSQMPTTQATVLDPSDPSEAILIGAREANAKVMQVLVLSFKKPSLVNTIAMSKTIERPVGKAWKVWTEFHDRFEPDDAISGMTMEDELMKIRIKKTEDPKNLMDRIAAIAVRYGCIISEDDQFKTAIRATEANHADLISTYQTTYEMVHH